MYAHYGSVGAIPTESTDSLIQNHIFCSGADYTVTTFNLMFGSTSEREAVLVDIMEDMLVEGEEDVMLSLTAATVGGQSSSGAQLGAQQDTRITIGDNDGEMKHTLMHTFVFCWMVLCTVSQV